MSTHVLLLSEESGDRIEAISGTSYQVDRPVCRESSEFRFSLRLSVPLREKSMKEWNE